MASSSRWLALRIGFCRLNPNLLTRRLTCAGWRLVSQAFHPLLSGALHPLADGPFRDPKSVQPRSFSSKARKRLPSRQSLAWLNDAFSTVEFIIPTSLGYYAEINNCSAPLSVSRVWNLHPLPLECFSV